MRWPEGCFEGNPGGRGAGLVLLGALGSPGAQSKAKALAQEWREELAPGEWQLDSSGQLLVSHN